MPRAISLLLASFDCRHEGVHGRRHPHRRSGGVFVQRFGLDPRAFATTAFAGLMRDAGAGKTRLESTMKRYYGAADEASPEIVGSFVPTRQRNTFGKKNIEDEAVPYASHRGTFLDATYHQLRWFDDIRLGSPP